jgi:hypothetical protein
MGDCRVKIVIARSLAAAVDDDPLGDDGKDHPPSSVTTTTRIDDPPCSSTATVSFAAVYSSDTTIREVMQGNKTLWKILNESSTAACRLWDVTFYPPVDVTSWPLLDFSELQGPKSKTLHSAGWFPSGTILVIPTDMTPNQFSDKSIYEDTQYNQHQPSLHQGGPLPVRKPQPSSARAAVEFENPTLRSGDGKPLPSQVMASVTSRFEHDQHMNEDDETTRRAKAGWQRQSKRERRQRQQDRTAKLDACIARLEQEALPRNKRVSDQVLRMLVKSRATGDQHLKMMDRVYFQCVVLSNVDGDSEDGIKEYRYFSPQDTFAKIAGTFTRDGANDNHNDILSEVLCRQKIPPLNGEDDIRQRQQQNQVYRRFPVTMRIYEAIAQGYLSDSDNQVDTLIVRWYRCREDATPSILEEEEEEEEVENDKDSLSVQNDTKTTAAQATGGSEKVDDMSVDKDGDTFIEFEDTVLWSALAAMDGLDDKGKKRTKKVSTSSAIKVKQMKIKAKATGDTKRIPKVENRVFLEVVTVADTATSGFYFLSKTDPIERILQYCNETSKVGGASSPVQWEFLVPGEKEGYFRNIETASLTTQEAEEQNILSSFGRLILRQRKQ